MAFSIPSSVFDVFNDTVSGMLSSSMAPECTLVMSPKRTQCPNCIVNTMSGSSGNKYKSGGPKPFTSGQVCPWCQGKGHVDTEYTETVRLLIDWEPKLPLNLVGNNSAEQLQFPNGVIKVQGDIADLVVFKKAVEFKIHNGLATDGKWRYTRDGEPIPYGLNHKNFFSCYLKRVG